MFMRMFGTKRRAVRSITAILLAEIALVVGLSVAFPPSAEAATTIRAVKTVQVERPQAFKVVRASDGNLYSLYKWNGHRAAAFTGLKRHARSVTVPRWVKYRGKRFEVTAIHEVGLFERADVKRVRILAKNLETVEEPALYRDWRKCHGKTLRVSVKYRSVREWLNAEW